MRLPRDAIYSRYQISHVFTGLRPEVIDALPRAMAAYLATPSGRGIRGRISVWQRRDLELRLQLHVMRSTSALTPDELASSAIDRMKRQARAFPVSLTISGDSVAITHSHAVADGRGSIEFVRWVIASAAKQGYELPLESRPLFPYLRMLRRYLQPELVRAYRRRPQPRSGAPVLVEPTDADPAMGLGRLVVVRLDARRMQRVRSVGGRGIPVSMTVGGLVLAALRRIYEGAGDPAVRVPIDLRRWAPPGRIDGNFIEVAAVGSLLATEWSGVALGRALSRASRGKMPIVASVAGIARAARDLPADGLAGVLRRRRRSSAFPGVSLSLFRERFEFEQSAWSPGSAQVHGVAASGPWPSATFASVLEMEGGVRLSVWDESGWFGLERLERALEEELAMLEART